jgi:hypothetical protein
MPSIRVGVAEARPKRINASSVILQSGAEVLTPIQFTEFVLAAQAGQKGDGDTALILSTVDNAMSNISEELKSIKHLVARNSQPAELLFLGPGAGKSNAVAQAAAEWTRRNPKEKND